MSGKLIDALYAIVLQFRWKYITILFLGFFFAGWSGMWYFEPSNEMVRPTVYWWYFVTDVMRSGYSGYSPMTFGGRLVSLVCTMGGGVCFLAAICKVIGYVFEQSQRKTKGLSKMNLKDHIVILGYRAAETDELIKQLTSDLLLKREIVLCTRKLEQNPYDSRSIHFISGDTSSDDVMEKACVSKASRIVICGHDDDQRTLGIAILAHKIARPDAHIVVHFESEGMVRYMKAVSARIHTVTSFRAMILAQAVCNPGSTKVIHELLSINNPGTIFRIDIPAYVPEVPFRNVLSALHSAYRMIVSAYADSHEYDADVHVNPHPEDMIRGGMSLFYIAEHPVDRIIDWGEIAPITEDELAEAI